MDRLRADKYLRYNELTDVLSEWANARRDLLRLVQLGESYEGRTIWMAVVTAFATGEADAKPAMWIDGNLHATELAPSSAALVLIDSLLSDYGTDLEVTRCLDTRAFYICPRVNPDGAELALSDTPRLLRSSTRPWPFADVEDRGLIPEDIDGDGRILSMRIRDNNGPWKPLAADPRLMVRRDPTEVGGEYYRVMPEGRIRDYDGVTIPMAAPREGLDLNRNFPAGWRTANAQKGSGPYPTSEPEVRALVDFIAGHPNIGAAVSLHTFAGTILRPHSAKSDAEMPVDDLRTYKRIGAEGHKHTGYPVLSVFHDFRSDPSEVMTGAFDDWVYEHLGAFGWTVEIWSPLRHAGIDGRKPLDWMREHDTADDLALIRWSDEVLGDAGFVSWRPFEHPQLGAVELGGWDDLRTWRNPPEKLLHDEIAPLSEWFVWHLLISPLLEVVETSVEGLGDGLYNLRFAVQNSGWLPTYTTKQALDNKLVRPVFADIELPAGVTLVSGEGRMDLGHLEGRAYNRSAALGLSSTGTPDRALVRWTVRAPSGGQVRIRAHQPRSGSVEATVSLGNTRD